jgi:hypothetical protein
MDMSEIMALLVPLIILNGLALLLMQRDGWESIPLTRVGVIANLIFFSVLVIFAYILFL